MNLVFDIDGTICTLGEVEGDYSSAKPIQSRIDIINKLYDEGHTIKLYTARGMGRHLDDPFSATAQFESLTKEQLKEWGVKYHLLILGKPSGDIYIDDKGIHPDDFFNAR